MINNNDSKLSIIDSHCHLQDFGARAGEIWKRARHGGVDKCINVGTSLRDCFAALRVAKSLEGVFFAGGLHPVDAGRLSEEWNEISKLCSSDECVAVGETGLDFFKGKNRSAQIKSLEVQLEFAVQINKPVILHIRPSARDMTAIREIHDIVFSVLRQQPKARCVFHCFSGSKAEAREAISLGHYLSFSGTITYNNDSGNMLAEAARFVPEGQVMVETDAPYLRPLGCPEKRNEPLYVKYTISKLAQIRKWSFVQAINQTTKNAKELFNL